MQLCPPPSPVVQVPLASPGLAQQECPLFLGQEWCWGLAPGGPLTQACLGDPPKASGRQDLHLKARRGWPLPHGSLREQRQHCASLVAVADPARRGQGTVLGSFLRCLGVHGGEGAMGFRSGSPRVLEFQAHSLAQGGPRAGPLDAPSQSPSLPPRGRPSPVRAWRTPPARAHLCLAPGGGQELAQQEQDQRGGSGHGCARALSGAGGGGSRGSERRAGRAAGRMPVPAPPARHKPPIQQGPPGASAPPHTSPPRRQGKERNPVAFFWLASELNLSPGLMSYTHTPFSKKERRSFLRLLLRQGKERATTPH